MPETNQLLLNYYKKEEMKKVKELSREKASLKTILNNVNLDYITKEEVLEILGEDYENEIEESKAIANIQENVNMLNTYNENQNTPMEIAKQYKKYFEEYSQDRKQICKDKNISNGTFQKYLRLNYLIPELQGLVDDRKLGINSAEHISFIDERNQFIIFKMIQNYNYEITDILAQKIKRDYRKCKRLKQEYILNRDKIDNYKNEKTINIIFIQEEVKKYFDSMSNSKIKEYIISILEDTQDV